MLKKIVLNLMVCILSCLIATTVFAQADKTEYPVVFAHGMMGFDSVVGLDYFGNDMGVFVGDACNEAGETHCNSEIDEDQQAVATRVNPFESAEKRGLQLANEIESYMASKGVEHVNIIGHSQGGMDARKAAKILHDRMGHQVVEVLISISSPHRGTPVAKATLEKEGGIQDFVEFLADYFASPILYRKLKAGNMTASLMSMVYNDYNPTDGKITGAKAFNEKYNVDPTYVDHYASIITAQKEGINPILQALHLIAPPEIDGDGWCAPQEEGSAIPDCNNDGAAGSGDGKTDDLDDDGLVGINSQQMGHRLAYKQSWWFGKYFDQDSTTGYVGDLNSPSEIQAVSNSSIINYDHLDVTGLGIIPYLIPDKFNEEEFYADLIDYIEDNESTEDSGGWWIF